MRYTFFRESSVCSHISKFAAKMAGAVFLFASYQNEPSSPAAGVVPSHESALNWPASWNAMRSQSAAARGSPDLPGPSVTNG